MSQKEQETLIDENYNKQIVFFVIQKGLSINNNNFIKQLTEKKIKLRNKNNYKKQQLIVLEGMQKLQKLDFFSEQFSFLLGPEKKKKTPEGGLYTIIAFSLSIGYLIYLLVFYFENKFIPKITSQLKIQTNKQNITFSQSIFGFTYSSIGQTLQQLQQSTGKLYLIFQAYQSSIALQQQDYVDLSIIDCTDQNFQGYFCLDFSKMSDQQKTLFIDPNTQQISQYILTVQPCVGLPTCASPDEIKSKIIDTNFQFYVKIRIVQFNEQTQQYEEGFQIDLISFDDGLALQNQYQLIQSITTVNQGFLFQTSSIQKSITGFQKSSAYYTQNNLLKKAGFTGYAQLFFYLQQNQQINHIQYPLITEVLAQFMPILNILFTIGIFTRLFSEQKIVENLNALFLKEQYCCTALKLVSNEQKDRKIKMNETNNKNIIHDSNKLNQKSDRQALEKNSRIQKNSKNPLTVEKIIDFQKQIDESELLNEEKSKFQSNFFQFFKQYFFGFFIKQPSENDLIYQKMCNFTKKSIDIFELYRNIIRINKAIKILMSKEQYAALQFCGCEIELDQIDDGKRQIPSFNNNQKPNSQTKNSIQQQDSNNHPNSKVAVYPDLEEAKNQQKIHLNEEKNGLNMSYEIFDIDSAKNQVFESYNKQISKYKEQQFSLNKRDNQQMDSDRIAQLNSSQINNHLQQSLTNQDLTQIDLNIYSSLIGKNYAIDLKID
ncbi:hypothetical protein ABPG74_022622 [Tetrahymena malaccensis]